MMKLRDLLPNAFQIFSLELIVALNPARIIAVDFCVRVQLLPENRTAYRMDKKSLPRSLTASRFQYEFAAAGRNNRVE